MLIKQLLQEVITVKRHLPLPRGTTHVVIANDIFTSGLGAIYTAEEGIMVIAQCLFTSPMDVLYYQLDYNDIVYLESKLSDLTKDDVISLEDEVKTIKAIEAIEAIEASKPVIAYFGKLQWSKPGFGVYLFVEHNKLDETLESLARSYSKYYGEPYEVESFDIETVHPLRPVEK